LTQTNAKKGLIEKKTRQFVTNHRLKN
jgi:hypothetical protein